MGKEGRERGGWLSRLELRKVVEMGESGMRGRDNGDGGGRR